MLAQPKFFLLKQDFGGSDSRELIWDVEANDYEQKAMAVYGVPFYKPGEEINRRPMPINVAYEIAKDRVEAQIARKRITENPTEFIGKFLAQTFTFWFIVETKKKSMIIGGMALIMLFLVGVGIYKAKQNRKDTFPVLLVLLYFHLLYAVILAFARYSFPLYPTLLIFASYAIDNALTNRHNSRNLHANGSLPESGSSG